LTPAFAAANRVGAKPPCRLAVAYVPNGIVDMSQFHAGN